jgi:hypothetical protein
MTMIDNRSLVHVRGAAGTPHPYGLWTTWGSKTAGQPAPPIGDPSGIRYTFWGRPGADAIILSGPGR